MFWEVLEGIIGKISSIIGSVWEVKRKPLLLNNCMQICCILQLVAYALMQGEIIDPAHVYGLQ